jgi:hypothetical protein
MNGRTYCATLGKQRVLVMVGSNAKPGTDCTAGGDGGDGPGFDSGGDEVGTQEAMGDEEYWAPAGLPGSACSAAASVAALALRGFDVVGVSYSDDECPAEQQLRARALEDMRASKPSLSSLSSLYDTSSRPSSPSFGAPSAGGGGLVGAGGGGGGALSRDLHEFCILPHQEATGAYGEPELRLWRITASNGDCQFGTMVALRDFAWLPSATRRGI